VGSEYRCADQGSDENKNGYAGHGGFSVGGGG
jgi:hypothetical protein